MKPSFTYFDEHGSEVPVSYSVGLLQPSLPGFARGVKWRADDGKEIMLFRPGKQAVLCPLLNKESILVAFRDLQSFLVEDNLLGVYDKLGRLIHKVNLPSAANRKVLEHTVYWGAGRWVSLMQEDVDGATNVTCTAQYPIANGWRELYEQFAFDENNLQLGKVIKAWEEL